MDKSYKKIILTLFGRNLVYRIGRALYQLARAEIANNMLSNGEVFVQLCVIEAWQRECSNENKLVIFDVGANIGDWTAELLKQLENYNIKDHDIYLFEPAPSTFDTLKSRLGNNIHLHFESAALSSLNGDGIIYIKNQKNAGTNSLHSESLSVDHECQAVIIKITATTYCENKNIQQIHLLKCDAEGHDMEIIRGALPMLVDEKIKVLQFEYNHTWISSRNFIRDVFIILERLPYKLTKLQHDHLIVFNDWHPELEKYFDGNYALVHMDALSWFPIKYVTWDCYNTMNIK